MTILIVNANAREDTIKQLDQCLVQQKELLDQRGQVEYPFYSFYYYFYLEGMGIFLIIYF